jgi:hypothetical protein
LRHKPAAFPGHNIFVSSVSRAARISVMKTKFIKSIVTNAKTNTAKMPWERGAMRAAMIARRTASVDLRKSA